jgi:hypothetical protein
MQPTSNQRPLVVGRAFFSFSLARSAVFTDPVRETNMTAIMSFRLLAGLDGDVIGQMASEKMDSVTIDDKSHEQDRRFPQFGARESTMVSVTGEAKNVSSHWTNGSSLVLVG